MASFHGSRPSAMRSKRSSTCAVKLWSRISGKYSDLEMDVEDLSVYIARYDDKLVEVHLDYFGRKAQRRLVFFCVNNVIEMDFLNSEIKYSGETSKVVKVDSVDPYIEEMRYFFQLIKGNCENINSLQNAINVLKIALIC